MTESVTRIGARRRGGAIFAAEVIYMSSAELGSTEKNHAHTRCFGRCSPRRKCGCFHAVDSISGFAATFQHATGGIKNQREQHQGRRGQSCGSGVARSIACPFLVLTRSCFQITLKSGEKAVYCRCWKSATFPKCDGAHNKHNEESGDNVGPIIVSVPKE